MLVQLLQANKAMLQGGGSSSNHTYCGVFLFCCEKGRPTNTCSSAVFSFLYLKKIKFQKYMSVLENFKNIPQSPYGGATGLKCNFFLQICNEVPGEKKEGGLSPPQRATGPCRPPQGRQGPLCQYCKLEQLLLFFFFENIIQK